MENSKRACVGEWRKKNKEIYRWTKQKNNFNENGFLSVLLLLLDSLALCSRFAVLLLVGFECKQAVLHTSVLHTYSTTVQYSAHI